MIKKSIVIFACLSLLALSGCSSSVSDAFKRTLNVLALNMNSSLVLVSNSTTEGEQSCVKENTIVIRKSYTSNQPVYCRDLSKVNTDLNIGPVCPGGVVINPLSISSDPRDISQMTICGVAPASIQSIGKRQEGGSIDELKFNNLPWGCEAKLECSLDPAFAEDKTKRLTFYVQPSECPFCPSKNERTCETCDELNDTEVIISGRVIDNSCSGTDCVPCETPQFANHLEGKLFFKSEAGSCGQRCHDQSLLRICENGFWKGDTSYAFPQCVDTVCGCTLPGDPISYEHEATVTLYRTDSPECGVQCDSQDIVVKCDDGSWKNAETSEVLSASNLNFYPTKTCAERICHCLRPGRQTVADGQTKTVYSKNLVSCTERCSDFDGEVTCQSGTLSATNPAFISYTYDQCGQEDCGCRVPLNGGDFVLLANTASMTLYRYSQNSDVITDACTNTSYQLQVTCNNKVLTPSYDPAIYRFQNCEEVPLSCVFTDGSGNQTLVDHNSTLTVSITSTPACGENCQNLEIKCDNQIFKKQVGSVWVVIDDPELIQYESATACTPRDCNCYFNGFVIPWLQLEDYYTTHEVTNCNPNGCLDAKATLTCTDTGLTSSRGDDPLDYEHRTCNVLSCDCPIALDGGSTIILENGGTKTLYQYAQNSNSVPDACTGASYQVAVTCTDKILTSYDPDVFNHDHCEEVPLSCTFIDGTGNETLVDHGASLTVSETDDPACGVDCNNLEIHCDNRVFQRWDGGWIIVDAAELSQYQSARACTPRNCDCNVNGFVIGFGQSDPDFYQVDKVTNCNLDGCTEARATLECTEAGPVSSKGDDPLSYLYNACEVIPCNCNVPWGGSIESGKTVKVFDIERSTCVEPQACQQTTHFTEVTCNNGQLTPYDDTVFQYPTCSPEVCTCYHAGAQTPFGDTLKVFESEEAPPGDICNSIAAELTCQEGGTWTGADPSQYPSIICTDLTDDGTGGGTGGGGGNDEGPGFGIKRRLGLGDGGGDGRIPPCLSFQGCRTNKIYIDMPSFRKKACILPWAGGEIEFYGSVTAFNTQCAVPPDRCSNHRIVRTCHFPKWTGSDDYRFPSCEEKAVCP